MNVIVSPIAEVQGELFAKATTDHVPAKAHAEPGRLEFSDALYEAIYTSCLNKGIPAALAIEITKVSGKFPDLYYDDFIRISNIAEREHYRNCMAGRFSAPDGDLPHHGRLLLHKLREKLKLHQKQIQAHVSCAYPTLEEVIYESGLGAASQTECERCLFFPASGSWSVERDTTPRPRAQPNSACTNPFLQ